MENAKYRINSEACRNWQEQYVLENGQDAALFTPTYWHLDVSSIFYPVNSLSSLVGILDNWHGNSRDTALLNKEARGRTPLLLQKRIRHYP